MGNENENGNGNADGGDNDTYCSPKSLRRVPPTEAFQQVDGFPRPRPPEQNSKGQDGDNTEQPNRCETTTTTASSSSAAVAATTTSTAMSPPQRPSFLMRRPSSLFGQLPVRSKSRLFDDLVTSNSNVHNNTTNKNNNADFNNNIAAETIMTTFSRSQSTWLQEDHQQSTLLGDDYSEDNNSNSQHQSGTEHPKPKGRVKKEDHGTGKSSLFGAVMRQFSSSITSALPAAPSSPFKTSRKRSSSNGSAGAGAGGGFRDLMASPSGKTIMNIVNQFNSPFKFQSPSSSHKKRHRRRRLWGDDDDDDDDDDNGKDGEADSYATPKKRHRMELDEEDETSKPGSNILFPDHENNDSRSSLGGGLVDEHWREAPIIDTDNVSGVRMEVLDWSLATKVRIEVHGGGTPRQKHARPITDTWIRDAMRDNEEALDYWIYQSPVAVLDESMSTNTPQSSGILSHHNNSTSNLAFIQKSIGTTKSAMSRQGYSTTSNRFDAKLVHNNNIGKSKNSSNNKKDVENDPSNSANSIAKYLIQSVRGPHAKYSRKRVLEENAWWNEPMPSASTSTTTLHDDTMREQSQRQWQQALRSLYSNYRRCVLRNNTLKESLNTMVLDTYFYCIGQDHSVLFRITAGCDRDSDGNVNVNDNKGKAVPVVLVSSTSDAFRKKLESNGMDLTYHNNNKSDGDESFQLLESIHEREATEKMKIADATAAAIRKNKRIFNNVLLSPDVRADLEALRRAQAFGESAGAEVLVKVKKLGDGTDEGDKGKEKLPKAIRISGWDNVSLFLEVYLNMFGDTMGMGDEAITENGASIVPLPFHNTSTSLSNNNKRLPLLICPSANDIGPFEHASLKRQRLFPAQRMPASVSESETKGESNTNNDNAMEICGILLPCTIRKLLLMTRNRILEDEKIIASAATNSSTAARDGANRMALKAQAKRPDDSDSSRYVVLHSTRPKMMSTNNHKELPKSWIGGLNGSMIFNQGRKKRKSKPKNGTNENHGNGSDNGQNQVFECSYGNVVSMAVWDTSREEVAACKLDSAFPDNWFHKK
jgi:hypothetical protein